MIKEGESLASGPQKNLTPLQRMWMELMKQEEAKQKQQTTQGNSSGRNLNPNRQPGGGGTGVNGGNMTTYVNNGIDKDENPNAHLLDD